MDIEGKRGRKTTRKAYAPVKYGRSRSRGMSVRNYAVLKNDPKYFVANAFSSTFSAA